MILQALNAYYWRKQSDPDPCNRLPAYGLEEKEIPFIIEIDVDGRLVNLTDTRSVVGKKKIGHRFLVPQGVKKTSGVAANVLWDTTEYVLGVDTRGKPERVAEQHLQFRARILGLPAAALADDGVQSVLAILDALDLTALEALSCWQGVSGGTSTACGSRMAQGIPSICRSSACLPPARSRARQTISRRIWAGI